MPVRKRLISHYPNLRAYSWDSSLYTLTWANNIYVIDRMICREMDGEEKQNDISSRYVPIMGTPATKIPTNKQAVAKRLWRVVSHYLQSPWRIFNPKESVTTNEKVIILHTLVLMPWLFTVIIGAVWTTVTKVWFETFPQSVPNARYIPFCKLST